MGWVVDTYHCLCRALSPGPGSMPPFRNARAIHQPSKLTWSEIIPLACKIQDFAFPLSVDLFYGWFSPVIKCEGNRISTGFPAP